MLTSDIDYLSDEDILAELREESLMEVEDEDDEIEAAEESPQRPTKSEIHQAFITLSSYSLFAIEGADEIRRHTRQLSFLVEKNIRKGKTQPTIERFFLPSNEPATEVALDNN